MNRRIGVKRRCILAGVVGAALVTAPAICVAVEARNGMVVSASRLASEAGVEILREGGNAVDAAVATGFVLAVTFPQAGNIGGGGFMVARLGDGRVFTLDFRETAPAAAHRDMFLDEQGEVASERSLQSPLASGVPGSVAGLLRAWADHGSGAIPRGRLLAAAIAFAEDGFVLSEGMARSLNGSRDLFMNDVGTTQVFVRADGAAWAAGDRLVQRELAETLRRIVEHGRAGFYDGRTAELLAAEQAETGGLITREDLRQYRAVYREPVRGWFREYEIVSMPPPSSGGVMVVQMLNMLEAFDLDTLRRNSAGYVHLLTEIERRAYADRAEHLGDPDFWDVPVQRLRSKAYARDRVRTIRFSAATPSADVRPGELGHPEGEQTTHYSVYDAGGNAVAVTTTLNAAFGSGIVVDGAGFLLNNEMDDFSAKPGVPNLYGLIGGEANAIEPRKRMLSSMTPTIVLREGAPYLILGTPGGSTIITTVLQNFLNVVVHGMSIQEAIGAPRFHHQWLPDEITYENGALTAPVRSTLASLGHTLVERSAIGRANAILIDGDGVIHGAPDPRGGKRGGGVLNPDWAATSDDAGIRGSVIFNAAPRRAQGAVDGVDEVDGLERGSGFRGEKHKGQIEDD